MRNLFLCSLSAIAALAVLMGCTSGAQGTQSDGTGNGIVLKATTTPFPCPPEQSFAHNTNGENDIAPAYEEIRRTVQCIVRDNRPVTQQQSKDLYEYQQSLVAKKVVGWQGWVLDVTPARAEIEAVKNSRDPDFSPDLTIWIAMDDPTGKPSSDVVFSSVMLHGSPRDQVEQLRTWTDPLTRDSPWQKIEFSGEILSVNSYDYVDIVVSSIRTEGNP